MHLLIVEPSAIPGNWEWMRSVLSKAIETDDERKEEDVFFELMDGRMTALVIEGEIRGVVTIQRTGPWLWVIYAAGRVDRPRFHNIKRLMKAIEQVAGQFECSQIHMVGRDGWARVLKSMGYERFGDVRGRAHVRKVL